METNNQIHSFIRLVMNENLAQAQGVIRDTLNEKLNAALDEKFEAYAPAIFEELDPVGEEDEGPVPGDITNDGVVGTDDKVIAARRKAIGKAIEARENGEEEGEEGEEEGEEGDEEDDMSDQQLQSDENYQDMPSSEKAAMKRDRTYPSAPGSDGY